MTRPPVNAPLTGALLAAGAAVAFSLNDLAVKFLSGAYPLHEVMLIRALIGLACITGFAAVTAGGLARLIPRRPGRQAVRAVVILTSNLCYFSGLATMPFADAAAVAFVSPLILTALSVVFLGERVGPRRWSAVIAGLAGVVVMLRPGTGMVQPAALLVLASAVLYAVGYLMTRLMRGEESALSLSVGMQVAFILTSGSVGLMFGDGHLAPEGRLFAFLLRPWHWPLAGDWPWFVMAGLASLAGSVMITQAFRVAEAGLVAPMEYVAMPMAILWGAAVFGTWPDATSWLGIALVCGSGLYVIWRESRLKQEKS